MLDGPLHKCVRLEEEGPREKECVTRLFLGGKYIGCVQLPELCFPRFQDSILSCKLKPEFTYLTSPHLLACNQCVEEQSAGTNNLEFSYL